MAAPAARLALAAYVALAALVAAAGCAGEQALVRLDRLERVDRAPHMPDELTTYGLFVFSGKSTAFDYASRSATHEARLHAARAFAGVRFRYEPDPAGGPPRILVRSVVDVTLTASEPIRRDILEALDGRRAWMIAQMRTPARGNTRDAVRDVLAAGTVYRAVAHADLHNLAAPTQVGWRVVEEALRQHFAGRAEPADGTVFVLRQQPRLIEPPAREPTETHPHFERDRYLDGRRVYSEAGDRHLMFDVDVVISERLVPPMADEDGADNEAALVPLADLTREIDDVAGPDGGSGR